MTGHRDGSTGMNIARSLLVALTLAAARPLAAQSACGADSMYSRVPVFLRATVRSAADSSILPPLLEMSERLTRDLREHAGGAADVVPAGDSVAGRVPGAMAPVQLRVTPDGAVRWAAATDSATDAAAAAPPLLVVALEDARRAGVLDAFARAWHDTGALTVEFDLVHASLKLDGRPREQIAGPATLQAFTLRVPRESPPEVVHFVRTSYPWGALRNRVRGTVRISFVVDTTGHVDPASVRDVWESTDPRPTGDMAAFYDQFVHASREAVQRSRFRPARVAGCLVPDRTEVTFSYGISP